MREHEVPTHVQAEDRVLLGFTFPQIVAITAVCALAYGAYRYAPVGPSEVRMAIAVVFGLVGIAMVVGTVGGRRLPLVAADLLKYRLGARVYSGPVSQLVRAEAPAPPQPANKSGPGPFRLDGEEVEARPPQAEEQEEAQGEGPRTGAANGVLSGRTAGSVSAAPRQTRTGAFTWAIRPRRWRAGESPARDGRRSWPLPWWRWPRPFPRRCWPRARRMSAGVTRSTSRSRSRWRDGGYSSRRSPSPASALPSRCGPQRTSTSASGPSEGTRARSLRFWGSATLVEGERIDYSLPLHGPVPSFTVSWEDTLGQAGALTVEHDHIPYPLPEIEGELCDLKVTSLGWTTGVVSGVVESECVTGIEHPVELQTVAGHESVTETTVLDAGVTAITGTITATIGGSQAAVPFVPDGEARFRLPVSTGKAIHTVTLDASLEASLSIPVPPLTVLTHHPERVEQVTRTVQLHRPGDSDSDSQTATSACEDGTTETVTATAYAHVPSATITREVTVDVLHKEHVKAETVEREPVTRSREELLSLASGVGSDDPLAVLVLPEPESEDPPAEQEPADGLRGWFASLGWEWPW